ncbi:dihydroorotate dehydrogenase [Lasius niger]|uniref:Dihydroorotate dehydrogenase (fumarate) n=1 Tax=Lasius niger TaxID=67767 RepID=A0A0J7K8I1_LASNI|nr:dihydroorotate dehydrogenase [Lasius niger]
MNAAGVYCQTEKELNLILSSQAGAVVTKSATIEKRDGNPAPRQELLEIGSINSMGLPNLGFDYYLDYALRKQAEGHHNPVIISISGLSIAENMKMLTKISERDFQGLTELNLSCPNVIGKAQVGYDYDSMKEVLTEAFTLFKKPLGVKLPPYFDFFQFDAVAEILNQFPLSYVNLINSVGNGLAIDAETETALIRPKGGFGGLGGEMIKATALANVRAMRLRLKEEISIIGTGGVKNGQDVFEHVLCGADLVQVGTELWREGPEIFARLNQELSKIMQRKNYTCLSDFRGKLKTVA